MAASFRIIRNPKNGKKIDVLFVDYAPHGEAVTSFVISDSFWIGFASDFNGFGTRFIALVKALPAPFRKPATSQEIRKARGERRCG